MSATTPRSSFFAGAAASTRSATSRCSRRTGRRITDLTANKPLSYAEQAAATIDAMRRGDDVIYQGTVFDGRWLGYPDFLLKKSGASDLGDWHYEVSDTKLARTAKAWP